MNIHVCPKCGEEPIKLLIDQKLQRTCCGASFEKDTDWNNYCSSLNYTTACIEFDIIEQVYQFIWKNSKNINAKKEIEQCYYDITNLKDNIFKSISKRKYTKL